jgi:hypothetical protein
MTDLIERLKGFAVLKITHPQFNSYVDDAMEAMVADELERLEAEVTRWKGHHKASMEHVAERVAEIDIKDKRIAELEGALRMFADDKDDCVSPGMKRLAEAALQEDDK